MAFRGRGFDSHRFHFPVPREVLRAGAIRRPVTLERDETGIIVAECRAIPGCVSREPPRRKPSPTSGRPSSVAGRFGPSRNCPSRFPPSDRQPHDPDEAWRRGGVGHGSGDTEGRGEEVIDPFTGAVRHLDREEHEAVGAVGVHGELCTAAVRLPPRRHER